MRSQQVPRKFQILVVSSAPKQRLASLFTLKVQVTKFRDFRAQTIQITAFGTLSPNFPYLGTLALSAAIPISIVALCVDETAMTLIALHEAQVNLSKRPIP